jgi:hypothetical protein
MSLYSATGSGHVKGGEVMGVVFFEISCLHVVEEKLQKLPKK